MLPHILEVGMLDNYRLFIMWLQTCSYEAAKVVPFMQSRGVPLHEFTFINALDRSMGALDLGKQIHVVGYVF